MMYDVGIVLFRTKLLQNHFTVCIFSGLLVASFLRTILITDNGIIGLVCVWCIGAVCVCLCVHVCVHVCMCVYVCACCVCCCLKLSISFIENFEM